MLCGKNQNGIGAELGSIEVTEQIDAMEVVETDRLNTTVVTRVLASTFMPVSCFCLETRSRCTDLSVNIKGVACTDLSAHLFWNQVIDNLSYTDVLPAFIKSFSLVVPWGSSDVLKDITAIKGLKALGAPPTLPWWFRLS